MLDAFTQGSYVLQVINNWSLNSIFLKQHLLMFEKNEYCYSGELCNTFCWYYCIPLVPCLKPYISKQVATRTKAAIGKREGKIDNLTRLEVIQVEERKIAEDKKELAMLEEEKKQKLAKKKAAEVSIKVYCGQVNMRYSWYPTKLSQNNLVLTQDAFSL